MAFELTGHVKISAAVFIELTKVFDTLDHDILLKNVTVWHKRNN